MSRLEDILKEIVGMCPCLTRVEKATFGRTAELEFVDEESQKRVMLRLTGIHVWVARQSMIGDEALPENWIGNDVDYIDISEHSKFLKAVLKERLPLRTGVRIYDTTGVERGASGFRSPVHVSIDSSEGVLDVVCEGVEKVEGFGTGQ